MALAPQPLRDPFARDVRQAKQAALVARVARQRAIALVVDVIGAELVAVAEQRARAAEIDERLLGQQRRAGCRGERVAQQEIAIAARDVDRHAGVADAAQRGNHAAAERVCALLVADPRIEEIAHHVHRRRIARGSARKRFERGDGRWPLRRQVQVGQQQRRLHRASARVMTTSSVGTFSCMPERPVGTPAIRSTTSLPSTTLPNTQ
jgi:hypothetical protein